MGHFREDTLNSIYGMLHKLGRYILTPIYRFIRNYL